LINKPPFVLAGRKTLLLTNDQLGSTGAKTAACFIRYRSDDTAVVLDRAHAGKTVGEVLGFGGSIPIVASVGEALAYGPQVAIIGLAPRGGKMDEDVRGQVLECIEAGMDIVNGLHDCLADDEEVCKKLKNPASRIWDIRRASEERTVGVGSGCVTGAESVLLVGTDCGVGKMTVAYELYLEACRHGINASWAATGQTGMILRERGIAIDSVIGDYMSGAAEELVDFEGKSKGIVFVEGQGSLLHPGYGSVTLSLMLGVMPDCMVLVHDVAKKTVKDYDEIKIPALRDLIHYHQAIMLPFKEVPFAAVAINTSCLDEPQAISHLIDAKQETGLPVGDVIRFGSAEILSGIVECLNRVRRKKGDL
jgi:uncharacterized NAD-dependent epimerase/dehydratase family protein